MGNVNVEGYGTLWFPDNYSDDEIRNWVRNKQAQERKDTSYGVLGDLGLSALSGATESIGHGLAGLSRATGIGGGLADEIDRLEEENKKNFFGTGWRVPTDTVASKIGSTVGGIAPYALASLIPGGAIGAAVLGAGSGLESSAQRIKQARAEGRDISGTQEFLSELGGAALGTAQALPYSKLLGFAEPAAAAGIGALAKRAGATALEQALVSGGTEAAQNLIESGYRPERGILENVGEAALMGGIGGAGFGAWGHYLGRQGQKALDAAKAKETAGLSAATTEAPPVTPAGPPEQLGFDLGEAAAHPNIPTVEEALRNLRETGGKRQLGLFSDTPEPKPSAQPSVTDMLAAQIGREPEPPPSPLVTPESAPEPPPPPSVPPEPAPPPQPAAPSFETLAGRIGQRVKDFFVEDKLSRNITPDLAPGLTGEDPAGTATVRMALDLLNPNRPPQQQHLSLWSGLTGDVAAWMRQSNIFNAHEWKQLVREGRRFPIADPSGMTSQQLEAQHVANALRAQVMGEPMSGVVQKAATRALATINEIGSGLQEEGIRSFNDLPQVAPKPFEAPPPVTALPRQWRGPEPPPQPVAPEPAAPLAVPTKPLRLTSAEFAINPRTGKPYSALQPQAAEGIPPVRAEVLPQRSAGYRPPEIPVPEPPPPPVPVDPRAELAINPRTGRPYEELQAESPGQFAPVRAEVLPQRPSGYKAPEIPVPEPAPPPEPIDTRAESAINPRTGRPYAELEPPPATTPREVAAAPEPIPTPEPTPVDEDALAMQQAMAELSGPRQVQSEVAPTRPVVDPLRARTEEPPPRPVTFRPAEPGAPQAAPAQPVSIPEGRSVRGVVLEALRKQAKSLGLTGVDLKLVDNIMTRLGGQAEGVYQPGEQKAIHLAWGMTEPNATPEQKLAHFRSVLDREAIHALREQFTQQEWSVLVREAQKRGKLADAQELYKDQPQYADRSDLIKEEGVSNLFGDAAQGVRLSPPTQKLYERMLGTLHRVGNALRGYGFQNADDVIRRIVGGEVGAREPAARAAAAGAEAPELYSLPRQKPQPQEKEPTLADHILTDAAAIRAGQQGKLTDPRDIAVAKRLADSGLDLNRLAEIDPDKLFNIEKADLPQRVKDYMRSYIRLYAQEGKMWPKKRETFDDYLREALKYLDRDQIDIPKLKERETLDPAVGYALRALSTANINEISRLNGELAKNKDTWNQDQVLERQLQIKALEDATQKIWNTTIPASSQDGRNLSFHRKMLEGGFDSTYLMSRVKRILALPENVDLPPDVMKQMTEKIFNGQKALEDLQNAKATGNQAKVAAAEKAVKDAQADAAKQMAKYQKSTIWEKAIALWRAGLLTGPKTLITNDVGNGGHGILHRLSLYPASMVSKALGWAEGDPTEVVLSDLHDRGAWKAGISGAKEGAVQAKEKMGEVWRGDIKPEQEILGKIDQPRGVQFGDSRLGRWAQRYVDTVHAIHGAQDMPFRQEAYQRTLYNEARLKARNEARTNTLPEGMTIDDRASQLRANPTPEMEATAKQEAEFLVFSNDNPLSRGFSAFKRTARGMGPLGEGVANAADFIVPFSKVPSNVFLRLLEYSPLGLGTNATRAGMALAANKIANKAMTPQQRRDFGMLIGRGMTGTALMTLGYYAAKAGVMTGFRDETDKAGRAMDVAAQRPEMSLKVGDKWMRVDRLAPGGNLMAIGAALFREGDRPLRIDAQRAGNIMAAATHSMMEMPFLQGIDNIIDFIKSPERSGTQYVQRQLGTIVPTGVANVAAALDPQMRDIRNQSLLAGMQQRLPFARTSLPPSIDWANRPTPEAGTEGILGRFGPLLDMFSTRQERQDPVTQELVRTQAAFEPPRIDTEHNESVDLYRTRRALSGALEYNALEKLINSYKYQHADTDIQRDLLKKAQSDARYRLSQMTTQNARYKKARDAGDEEAETNMLERYLSSLRI